jgi:hypothetical protein
MSNHTTLTQNLLNCNILPDDALSSGDHAKRLTFLPFRQMAGEQPPGPGRDKSPKFPSLNYFEGWTAFVHASRPK